MNETSCGWIQDRLPEYALGELDAIQSVTVEKHLVQCETCRGELELVQVLRDLRVGVPAGLDARVISAAVTPRRAGVWSPGRVAVAATVTFALITGVIVWRTSIDDGSTDTTDLAGPASIDWSTGDPAILRGGLDLGALSEDELMKLLEELDS